MRFILGSDSVGFLTLHNINGAGYLSSFLITDFKGIPIEFRCTHPIELDSLQISLYGSTLLSHVGIDLIGKPLLRSVENNPKLIFVDKPFLLKLDDYSKCPLMFVKMADTEENHAISETFGLDYHIEVIKPINDKFKTLEIVKKKKLKIKDLVERLYAEFDVLEPFERMKKAVKIILKQKHTSN